MSDKQKATVIETHALTKKYGELVAVNKLNLAIREGEVFGLLGPNGAGKTTTILMLMGLTEPTSGSVWVVGSDPGRDPLGVKRVVGYLPDNVGFYDDLTGEENLRYTARLNRLSPAVTDRRITELLHKVGLADSGGRKAREYSRGMRQRLGIADVLLKDPRIVILDEPTLGIDPKGVQEVLDLILRLSREEGKTVLVSSHLLRQVQEVCDRVGIFVRGRLMAQGSVSELGGQLGGGREQIVELRAEPAGEALLQAVRAIPGVDAAEERPDRLVVRGRSEDRDLAPRLARELSPRGFAIFQLQAYSYNLDDIYREFFQEGESHVPSHLTV